MRRSIGYILSRAELSWIYTTYFKHKYGLDVVVVTSIESNNFVVLKITDPSEELLDKLHDNGYYTDGVSDQFTIEADSLREVISAALGLPNDGNIVRTIGSNIHVYNTFGRSTTHPLAGGTEEDF